MNEKPVNSTLMVVGYGSLMSGYGLTAVRRGGRSRLTAREAFPVALGNARRGLAKPSSHGDYLAMDLEPRDRAAPLRARVGMVAGTDEIGALGLVFDREAASDIARREEYDPSKFVELLALADHAAKPLGEFLLAILRRAAFDQLAYRRELFRMLGYTSPGYIFHPLPFDDGRVAIVAIASGFEGSGDPGVPSRRRECGMARLLTLPEAMTVASLPVDPEGQLGYFAECILASRHGIGVADLIDGVQHVPEIEKRLTTFLAKAASGEKARFMKATGLNFARYQANFGTVGDGPT